MCEWPSELAAGVDGGNTGPRLGRSDRGEKKIRGLYSRTPTALHNRRCALSAWVGKRPGKGRTGWRNPKLGRRNDGGWGLAVERTRIERSKIPGGGQASEERPHQCWLVVFGLKTPKFDGFRTWNPNRHPSRGDQATTKRGKESQKMKEGTAHEKKNEK